MNDKIIKRINAERTIDLERYREEGCESRYAYLCDLADYNEVNLEAVLTLIDVLGPDEDFDGLVSRVEDLSMMGEFRD